MEGDAGEITILREVLTTKAVSRAPAEAKMEAARVDAVATAALAEGCAISIETTTEPAAPTETVTVTSEVGTPAALATTAAMALVSALV